MKKIILLLCFVLLLFGCSTVLEDKQLNINIDSIYKLEIDEEFDLTKISDDIDNITTNNSEVIIINEKVAKAIKTGIAKIEFVVKEESYSLIIQVINNNQKIEITGSNNVAINSTTSLVSTIIGCNTTEVEWTSSDIDVASVENGVVTGHKSGISRIIATLKSDESIYGEMIIFVYDPNVKTQSYEDQIINEYISKEETINLDQTNYSGIFTSVINSVSETVVGVKSYNITNRLTTIIGSGSGVIYKRIAITKDNEIIEDTSTITDLTTISTYKYFVITNKHLVNKSNRIMLYFGENIDDIEATLIASDNKVDLSVLTFESLNYYKTAKFASSDDVKTGEFVFAIGNPESYSYFRSVTRGIVSYPTRYVSSDTDDDGTSDWDAEYIQHDAAIQEGNSGGPLINLEGKIIGINTLKLSSTLIDNMGFAIPSNLVVELVSQLEKGIVPERPLLGITMTEISITGEYSYIIYATYIVYGETGLLVIPSNSSSTTDIVNQLAYDGCRNIYAIAIPINKDLEKGFLVTSVNQGGIAEKANLLPNDIIVKFNGVNVRHSYELRAELGKCIIGSNEEIEIGIYRDGEYRTVTAIF